MTLRRHGSLPVVPDTFIHGGSALARVARPLAQFLRIEAGGGLALIVATAVALVWANSPWDGAYETLWATRVRVDAGALQFDEDLLHVVNDGLMALFFFIVGLEIKRELVVGELRDRRQVALPAIAALGGMVVPAALYVIINAGGNAERGWGIPMATDIAFALGLVAVLGSRVPSPLKVFLLTLAIVDDIGAIVVIAIFYSEGVSPAYLALAVAVALVVAVMRAMRITYAVFYVVGGLVLWFAVHESGVHATIAGVVMGLLTPARPLQTELESESVVDALENRDQLSAEDVQATALAIRGSISVCDRMIEVLHPWTSYVVVPLFALANAGIILDADALDGSSRVFLGVVVGLVVGKTIGITGFAWVVTRLGIAALPEGVRWWQMTAIALLAGIGFTVSLFITALAFAAPDDPNAQAAKIGILIASVLAAIGGAAAFVIGARRRSR